jgi:hypothetical protein
MVLRKAQRWVDGRAQLTGAAGPLPEDDTRRILEMVTGSTLFLTLFLPRWCTVPRGAGGMAEENKPGVEAFVVSVVELAARPCKADAAAWDLVIILSGQVGRSWRWPLEPSGPPEQVLKLRVTVGLIDLTPMQTLYDKIPDFDGLVGLERERVEMIKELKKRLEPDPLPLHDRVPLQVFVLAVARGGATSAGVFKDVYLHGQVAYRLAKRVELVLRYRGLSDNDPFPDDAVGNRKITAKYNVTGRSLLGAIFEKSAASRSGLNSPSTRWPIRRKFLRIGPSTFEVSGP